MGFKVYLGVDILEVLEMEITKLVCLGDSITWGFPYGPMYSWVDLSQKDLGINMINRGINGSTAEDLVNRFNSDVIGQIASHVLIMIGSNDANFRIPLQEYSESIITMFDSARSNGISTIYALPVPSMDKWMEYTLEKYRYWLTEFASKNNISVIDFSPGMRLADGKINPDYFVDDVHPSKNGYQAMADVIINFFRSGLK